jgi:hypothetical protein
VTTPDAFLSHDELVAVAWLKTVARIPSNSVGTTVPGDNTTWAASGFIQASGPVGGNSDIDVPLHRPVMQIDTWACNLGSAKPPWGKANQLAALIIDGCYGRGDDPAPTQRTVILPAGYQDARVLAAYATTRPRRNTIVDDARMARYTFDLALHWTAA